MKAKCVAAVRAAAKEIGRESITDAEIAEIDARLRRTMRQLARAEDGWQGMSYDQRVSRAAEQALADIRLDAQRKVTNTQLQIVKTAATEERIKTALRVFEGEKRAQALVRDMDQTGHYIGGIRSEAMGRLMDLIDAVQSREGAGRGRRFAMFLFDAENPRMTADLATEVFRNADGSTGNKVAQQGAKAWLQVIEELRQRFNAAGGDVGRLEYGYVPQPHDAAAVRAVGRDAWVQRVLPLVDRSRYVDEAGARLPDAEVQRILAGMWETIATDGINKQEPGSFRGSGARANRGSDHRELHFKDGQAYLAYLHKFGNGTMLDAMAGHIGGIARDIGLVERYGPNPNAQMRLQFDLAARADGTKPDNLARSFGLRPQSYWDQLSGAAGSAQSARIAQIGTDVRNVQTFGKLSAAVISSITDVGTYVITTGYNGLPYWDAIRNIGKTAASAEAREFLTTHGIIAESMMGDLTRWTGEHLRHNWSGMLAQSTMKLSLMNAWTDTLRRAFSLTMMQGLARMSKTEWANLTAWDRTHLERAGITEADWRVISAAQLTEFSGREHLTPESIRAVDVETVRPEDMQRIRDQISEQTAELRQRNAQELEFIRARNDKFDTARDTLNRRVKDLRARKDAKNAAAAGLLEDRIDLLEAQLDEARLQAELESDYNRLFTRADLDAFEVGMRSAAADLNRASSSSVMAADRAGEKLGRRRQRIEQRMRDIEKRMNGTGGDEARLQRMALEQAQLERATLERDIEEAFKAYPEAERQAFRAAVDSFGEVRRSASEGLRSAETIGRRYGQQKGRLQRRVHELENRIAENIRRVDREVDTAARDAQKKADDMAQVLADFVKRSQQRQDRRAAVIQRLMDAEGPRVQEEADRIRNEVVAKVLGLITDESEMAVINPDLATKTLASGGGMQRGTVHGELARSVMQFKSFPIAMISRHWRRMLEAPQVGDGSAPVMANRLMYAGALMLTTTALGAVSLQAKQIVAGKDPIDMTGQHGWKFWARALAQGGGLSIVGDMLLNDPGDSTSDAARGMVGTLAGPAVSTVAQGLAIAIENAHKALNGKPTHAGAETANLLRQNAPYVNLWYAKAALDHAGMHALQENLSPGYLGKMQQRAAKEWGQQSWWAPGTGLPQRAPDFGKAVGQ